MQRSFVELSLVVGKLLADRWMTRRNATENDERSNGPNPVVMAEKGQVQSSRNRSELRTAAPERAESNS